MTTDYYQGDEGWWKQTFRRGKPQYAFLRFDMGARVFAVPIYLPVRDPASGDVIGVAKALLQEHLLTYPAQEVERE